MPNMYAMIMAGGRGERFWPLSTASRPKQFLKLFGDSSLLAKAVDRLAPTIPNENVYVVTNHETAEATREAVPSVPPGQIIGEPCGRDTAAACACGMAAIRNRDPDGVICVLTADHIIGDTDVFRQTLEEAAAVAAADEVLITIGLRPSFPSTGFGYVQAAGEYEHGGELALNRVERFVEKPDLETAQRYLEAGNYFWNAGMFIWSCSALGSALAKHSPHLATLVDDLSGLAPGDEFHAALETLYPNLEKISVDYALMEKADNILTIQGTFAWDDVGAWDAVAKQFPSDEAENVVRGQGEVVDGARNIVISEDRMTGVVGLDDVIVVQAGGATLVCHRDHAQDVKRLVRQIEERGDCSDLL